MNSPKDFDIQLLNLPAFTSLSPSLALASLSTFLKEKGYEVHAKDYSFEFFKNDFKNLKITNNWDFNIPSYFLFGVSNWLNFTEELFSDEMIPRNLLKSLCPVSNELYEDIYKEIRGQKAFIKKILDGYVKELESISAKYTGFSVNVANAAASLYVAHKLKLIKPEKKILFGGSETSFTYRPNFYLSFSFIDAVIYHPQGEIPLYQIIKSDKNIRQVKGIGYKNNNKQRFTDPPPLLELNKLPIPDYDLIDIKEKYDVINIYFSRGCNSRCLFCNEKSFFSDYFMKSPQKVIEEICFYKDQGFDKFETIDLSFNNSPKILNDILDKIKENDLKITWGGNAECYRMNEKLLIKCIKSGLTHSYYGIESGSKKVLSLMKKPIKLDEAIKLLRLGNTYNLKQFVYIIVGFPGETNQDFEETRNFLMNNKNLIEDSMISIYSLLNGSEMFNNELIKPIQLDPLILNAFTYESLDGITHDVRKQRYLNLKRFFLNKNK